MVGDVVDKGIAAAVTIIAVVAHVIVGAVGVIALVLFAAAAPAGSALVAIHYHPLCAFLPAARDLINQRHEIRTTHQDYTTSPRSVEVES